MNVTETSSQGLQRRLKVVVDAGELERRFATRLEDIKDRVQIKGFRKGKVPAAHLKKVYGRSLMAEVLQAAVEETSRQAVTERKERPAFEPKIEFSEDKDEIERVLSGESDLAFDMSFEVLPEIVIPDLANLELERLVADVDPEAVDKAMDNLAARNTTYEAEDGRTAQSGDRLLVDFTGKIEGAPFEGGSGEAVPIMLGQGGFLPGFEQALEGARAGETRAATVTFPADYGAETLRDKAAEFEIAVKEVAPPKKPALDDAFATGLGVESLDKLREYVTQQVKSEYDAMSRTKLKRALLDKLDATNSFPLPPSLVDREFEGIWRQVTESLTQAGKTLADEGKSEDEAKAEYRKIAERRVRLGLLIGEIGEKNNLQVSQEELRRALVEQARRFPGREKMVYDYFEKTPGAVAELRAPLFEDKVVDFIVELAKPAEKRVSHLELFAQEEEAAAAGAASVESGASS